MLCRMSEAKRGDDTIAVHAGEPRPRIGGAVVMPVFQSATFEHFVDRPYDDLKYIRLNNTPNHDALHAKLAALEGTEAALVTASGMAAIASTLLAVLSSGDHMLVQDCLYGGTHALVADDLPAVGISTDSIDATNASTWAAKLKPNTKVIYVEAMSNPLLEVADLPAVVAFAKAHGLLSLIDATFASPINLRPAALGFDLVLHSATKYLNGHSDIVAGVTAGSTALVRKVRHKVNHLGGTLDPHACALLHRGLKTLGLRVRRQNDSALAIARFLSDHPKVASVRYPGLPDHPQHALAAELFAGFSGVLSFELEGGTPVAKAFVDQLSIAACAPSLGGVETLVTRPATTSHCNVPPAERARLGITDGLVRLAVGIEDTADLIADIACALA